MASPLFFCTAKCRCGPVWNSIRVTPGQHVERGEYLADSGNTG